jgi:hypothetical protein
VLRERAVEGDDEGMGQHISNETTVVTGTGLDGTCGRGYVGFDCRQLAAGLVEPIVVLTRLSGFRAIEPTDLFTQSPLPVLERLTEKLTDGPVIRNLAQGLRGT